MARSIRLKDEKMKSFLSLKCFFALRWMDVHMKEGNIFKSNRELKKWLAQKEQFGNAKIAKMAFRQLLENKFIAKRVKPDYMLQVFYKRRTEKILITREGRSFMAKYPSVEGKFKYYKIKRKSFP